MMADRYYRRVSQMMRAASEQMARKDWTTAIGTLDAAALLARDPKQAALAKATAAALREATALGCGVCGGCEGQTGCAEGVRCGTH